MDFPRASHVIFASSQIICQRGQTTSPACPCNTGQKASRCCLGRSPSASCIDLIQQIKHTLRFRHMPTPTEAKGTYSQSWLSYTLGNSSVLTASPVQPMKTAALLCVSATSAPGSPQPRMAQHQCSQGRQLVEQQQKPTPRRMEADQ